ncbi:MAG: helix-turn-helix domain-containing protein [Candidatus Sericytochromatia bacterium]|nr:helix-turn-helix domain-containing protein [Candidatus Sericytochromatia bacterium]
MTDVCQLLRETRLSKGLTLDEVAQRTYIKLHYLEALEEGRLDKLPAMVHTYGYIRQYAKLLGLDGGALVAQFQAFERAASAPRHARPPAAEMLGETLSFLRPIKTTYGNDNGNGNGGHAPGAAASAIGAVTRADAEVVVAPPPPVGQPPWAPAPAEAPPAAAQGDLMEARAQAQQILLDAEREARQLVQGAEGYADEVLQGLEAEVAQVLQIVQNGRQFLASRRRAGPTSL